ncbi:MAG: hypothetical protein IT579_21695 [Verrucomicrobia subdivision 3 bacterium]|nr:hypothetical protein [Limisphaerales bacterium]
MTTEAKSSHQIQIKTGLVAYFDILGYKNLLLANSVEDSIKIIDTAMLQALDEIEGGYKSITDKRPFDLETFVISDSILVALSTGGQSNEGKGRGTLFFAVFCAELMTHLFQKGLPTRGAIASGDFIARSKNNRVTLAGQPIVDAHELASSLELAGCAIVPSSEAEALFGSAREFAQLYQTPIKNSPACELHLLRYCFRNFDEENSISRKKIIECFEAHKKGLNPNSLGKLNNTIHFLKKCNQLPSNEVKTV